MRRFLIGSLIVAAVACCGGGAGSASSATPEPRQQARNPNLITAAEFAMSAGDLYSAIERARPAFFQTRGNASFGNGAGPEQIEVYVEGVHRGGVESLREINVADVAEVRRLSAAEATQRFGTGHTMGAVMVTLKKS
ncbi:MAG TPA: hypothetical protein VN706_04635 [Gemmatimonadaceae bacterium]|nr:hypothetical protein [Gemmatimonadaceae bacterium]